MNRGSKSRFVRSPLLSLLTTLLGVSAMGCGSGDTTSGSATIGTASASIDIIDDELPPTFNPGDVVINEIMKDPSAVGDGDGEYFEIYNTTASPIDLTGWTITDNDFDSHTISGAPNVPAGGYYILGINANSGTNGGITVDYEYSGITLSNGDDEVILTDAGGNEIDRVEYTDAASHETSTSVKFHQKSITIPDPTGSLRQRPSAVDPIWERPARSTVLRHRRSMFQVWPTRSSTGICSLALPTGPTLDQSSSARRSSASS